MGRFKGIVALDIDGTITVDKHHMDKRVSDYLSGLIEQKWLLIFITGRSFLFGRSMFDDLRGDYFFAVQNGSALFSMPSAHMIRKYFMSTDNLPAIASIFSKEKCGLVVESGKINEDVCYYCPNDFTVKGLEYIGFRKSISPEKWVEVKSFNDLPVREFSLSKYFADAEKTYYLANKVKESHEVNVIVMRDPFCPGNYLAHINSIQASKGNILMEFRKMYGEELPAVVAGDDFNDVGMLESGTFRIVMQNAPEEMYSMADLIAKPAKDLGIIDALDKVLRSFKI